MNKRIQVRLDKETEENIVFLTEKLKINKSALIRMAINNLVTKFKK